MSSTSIGNLVHPVSLRATVLCIRVLTGAVGVTIDKAPRGIIDLCVIIASGVDVPVGPLHPNLALTVSVQKLSD